MRKSLLVALLLVGAAPAWAAEEPSGCDKFKWPIERERAALTAPDRARLTSGSEQAALPPSGITLALVAPADARLPMPPEQAPRKHLCGLTSFKTAPSGLYTISLSAGGWSTWCRTDIPEAQALAAHRLRGHPQVREIRAFGEPLRAANQREQECDLDRDPAD